MNWFATKIKKTLYLSFVLVFLGLVPDGFSETTNIFCEKQISEITSSPKIINYAIERFKDKKCDDLAQDPVVKNLLERVNELGNPKIKEASSRFQITKDAFIALKERAARLKAGTPEFKTAKAELIERIDMTILFIASEESGNLEYKNFHDAPIYPGIWKIEDTYGLYPILDYQTLDGKLQPLEIKESNKILPQKCRNEYEPACSEVAKSAIEFIKLHALGEMIANYYSKDKLEQTYNTIQARNQKWDKYFFEALPQYPWEMIINSKFIKDDRQKDIYGNKLGPLEPPDKQFIIFHPSVGFEFMDDADGNHQFEPAINIEVVGYNCWKWDDKGDMKRPLGISAILTLSDRGGADAIGYGAMFHLNNTYSAGVTYRDNGNFAITVNVKLESLFRETFKKWKGDVLKYGKYLK